MEKPTEKFKVRLGMFIAGGLILFVLAIFVIGKKNNLFDPVFKVSAIFNNVSGLQVGNNIRFSGINIGTVDKIEIINDSSVQVDMLIKKNIKQFIKSDCGVSVGSEGLIGDRIMIISQGSTNAPLAIEGQLLVSIEPVEMDAIVASFQITAGNAEIISQQLAEVMVKINNGSGTLGRLIQDSTIAENFEQTLENLKRSSKGLNENMQAAQHNILLRGYFNKKAKAAEKLKEEEKKKQKKD